MSYDDYNDTHNFTFRFDSNDGERHLEMNCNELYLGDIFARFKEFLQGCGYEIHGQIGVVEYDSEEDYDAGYQIPYPPREKSSRGYELDRSPTNEPKWDFSNIPNNNWPFGGLTSEPIPALTTAQIDAFQTTSINALKSNQYPTMAPLTKEQIEAFTFKMEAPGTLGGAKVSFDKDAYQR